MTEINNERLSISSPQSVSNYSTDDFNSSIKLRPLVTPLQLNISPEPMSDKKFSSLQNSNSYNSLPVIYVPDRNEPISDSDRSKVQDDKPISTAKSDTSLKLNLNFSLNRYDESKNRDDVFPIKIERPSRHSAINITDPSDMTIHKVPEFSLKPLQLSSTNPKMNLTSNDNDNYQIVTDNNDDFDQVKRSRVPRLSLGAYPSTVKKNEIDPIKNSGYLSDEKTSIKKLLVKMSFLGKGASGSVYKTLHIPSLTIVAVKVILSVDPEQRTYLINELKACKCNFVQLTVSHVPLPPPCKNIVSFYEAFSTKDKICIVMEYMDGGTLANMHQLGPLNETLLANMTEQILKGLLFLHTKHYIHRDIKPSNLLINHLGEVKISDFGLLRELDKSLDTAETFIGTLSYMSPARLKGEKYGTESDIWSLGMILVTLGTGKYPYSTDQGYWSLLYNFTNNPEPRLSTSEYSSDFCNFIEQCLRKNNQEIATCEQLLIHPFIRNRLNVPITPALICEHTVEELKEVSDDCISFLVLKETIRLEQSRKCNPNNIVDDKNITFKRYNQQILAHLSQQLVLPLSTVNQTFDEKFKAMERRLRESGCLSTDDRGVLLGKQLGTSFDKIFD